MSLSNNDFCAVQKKREDCFRTEIIKMTFLCHEMGFVQIREKKNADEAKFMRILGCIFHRKE